METYKVRGLTGQNVAGAALVWDTDRHAAIRWQHRRLDDATSLWPYLSLCCLSVCL